MKSERELKLPELKTPKGDSGKDAAEVPYGTFGALTPTEPSSSTTGSGSDEAWSPSRKVLLYSTYAMSSVAVGLILGVVVNFDWWRSRGIAMIVDIQRDMSPSSSDFWTILSFIGWPGPMFITQAIYMGFSSESGLRTFYAQSWGAFVCSTVKTALQDCRPFWYSDRVEVFGSTCPKTWGLPSEHSAISAAFYPYLVWELYHSSIKATDALAQGRSKRIMYMLCLEAVAVAVVLLVGISRIALGVHFPYQVLLGWIVGGTTLVRFLADTPPISGLKLGAFSTGLGHFQTLVWAFMLSVSLSAIPCVTHAVVMQTWTVPPEWEVTANEVCEMDEGAAFHFHEHKTMIDAVGAASIIGTLVVVVHWRTVLFPFDTSVGHPLARLARVLLAWMVVLFTGGLAEGMTGAFESDSLATKVLFDIVVNVAVTVVVSVGTPLLAIGCCLLENPLTKKVNQYKESEEVKSLLGDPAAMKTAPAV